MYLARDCFLVTADSKHLIVCTTATIAENYSRFSALHRNSESLAPNTSYLDDYLFYSIDLEKGEICDQIHFDFDRIYISQGIYIVDRILAILSVQHQTIHMFEIAKSTGHFISLMQIGRGLHDDDSMFDFVGRQSQSIESCFTAFKQRFISFLYEEHKRKNQLDDFMKNITTYRSLKMHRIQMLGPDFIFVKMSHKDYLTAHNDPNNIIYMFVILEWRIGRIVGVFNRHDSRLLTLFEKCNEYFRNGFITNNYFPTSMQHCFYPKLMHERLKQNWVADEGQEFPPDACRRFLQILPYSITNASTTTPYLDSTMFKFDDRILTQIERGRVPTDTINPFRIFSQRTNRLSLEFEFDPGLTSTNTAKILFHPTDPFAFAFDKTRVDTPLQFYLPEFADLTAP